MHVVIFLIVIYISSMEFIRQVINSNVLKPVLSLPPSFHDIQVEVIVLPIENRKTSQIPASSIPGSENQKKSVYHTTFGRLKTYANPSLIPEEKGAWEEAVAEKHALY